MAILSHPAFGPRTSLAYITIGTLLDVWTVVWYYTFTRSKEVVSNVEWFFLIGLFLTGLVLVVIGTLLGPIGQAARRAELPPTEALAAEASVQQSAAANPHPVVPVAAGIAPLAAPAPQPQPITAPAPASGQQVFMGS